MKIRMLTTSAGPMGVTLAGAEIIVSEKEGKKLIQNGYAKLIEAPKEEIETATLEGAEETTVKKPVAKKKSRAKKKE